MQEKKLHKLIIDKQFKNLIPPLRRKDFEQLEKNIKKNGCHEPICVFKNIIIDGHNRYKICKKYRIPFFIQELEFNTREEIIIWICATQLGRKDISFESKKYLIGKRYEAEKIIQKDKNFVASSQYIELPQLDPNYKGRNKTSERLGKEYNISHNTVKTYLKFAKSIDYLLTKDKNFCTQIMNGNIKLTKQDVKDILTHIPSKINSVKMKAMATTNKIEEFKKVTIKDMPSYDPDGEIMSLIYTIPSWIGSMERILNKQDLGDSTENAKIKLKEELQNLKYIADVIILAMEGENE